MIHIEVRCYLAILVVITLSVPTTYCLTKYVAKYGMYFVAGDDLNFSETELRDVAKNALITLEYIVYNYHARFIEITYGADRIIKKLQAG